ncbi:putative lipid-binding transport protein (Tim44 family) [Rhodopseudomonas thermotolerans]|uniref:Lipid-binding transport protein (Tim44 family) n=2 Tax=Rhodopseudomonas TaxID=1073 RepID=A0A336JSQ2_9BRAD|nr:MULTISPECIES: Tim44-like domain-containing protein [Rhodopseudomonas]RED31773.1 putative lipid-binding transport protein (Tim44 family) [Rhodopseudomonas pentothenatexigens]REF93074.1 putative lipid-binding transport protein (Tim44 family) [Rhodopseudomonas thermotolerans]SSW91753.1 predicted lipid-binding transport protein (Tim44 family) [Rhodopseudomonas pentothenatexigens]
MNFLHRMRGVVAALAVTMALALPMAMVLSSEADARAGRSGSMGSRGSRSFAAPPSTNTAPGAAQPFNRTYSQPGSPGMNAPAAGAANKGGFFNRPGMGMLGGLAAGFLGAGLLGMLFGGGFLSGLGSFASIIGLVLQVVLVVILARLAWGWWQRRKNPQAAYAAGPAAGQGPLPDGAHAMDQPANQGPQPAYRSGFGFGGGAGNDRPLEIKPDDYEAFERLLGEVQAAWSNEDIDRLRQLATPEMASYFAKDLEENKAANDINKVSDVKLLQGDLAEAWREGETDFATVAMRFSLVDKTLERGTDRLVAGSETPIEATEIWTFTRRPGANWELAAIQQTN